MASFNRSYLTNLKKNCGKKFVNLCISKLSSDLCVDVHMVLSLKLKTTSIKKIFLIPVTRAINLAHLTRLDTMTPNI